MINKITMPLTIAITITFTYYWYLLKFMLSSLKYILQHIMRVYVYNIILFILCNIIKSKKKKKEDPIPPQVLVLVILITVPTRLLSPRYYIYIKLADSRLYTG